MKRIAKKELVLARREADGGVTGLARAVAELLEREGNVGTVFGAPVKIDEHAIIPVGRVVIGVGGGGVGALGAAVETVKRLVPGSAHVTPSRTLAGGAGLNVTIEPAGFLFEEDGKVVFTPIDVKH